MQLCSTKKRLESNVRIGAWTVSRSQISQSSYSTMRVRRYYAFKVEHEFEGIIAIWGRGSPIPSREGMTLGISTDLNSKSRNKSEMGLSERSVFNILYVFDEAYELRFVWQRLMEDTLPWNLSFEKVELPKHNLLSEFYWNKIAVP